MDSLKRLTVFWKSGSTRKLGFLFTRGSNLPTTKRKEYWQFERKYKKSLCDTQRIRSFDFIFIITNIVYGKKLLILTHVSSGFRSCNLQSTYNSDPNKDLQTNCKKQVDLNEKRHSNKYKVTIKPPLLLSLVISASACAAGRTQTAS